MKIVLYFFGITMIFALSNPLEPAILNLHNLLMTRTAGTKQPLQTGAYDVRIDVELTYYRELNLSFRREEFSIKNTVAALYPSNKIDVRFVGVAEKKVTPKWHYTVEILWMNMAAQDFLSIKSEKSQALLLLNIRSKIHALNVTVTQPPVRTYADCYHNNGRSYNGKMNFTASGRTCLRWAYHFEHRSESANYCRNPSDHTWKIARNKPWCYSTDPTNPSAVPHREDCNVRQCADPWITKKNVLTSANGHTVRKETSGNGYEAHAISGKARVITSTASQTTQHVRFGLSLSNNISNVKAGGDYFWGVFPKARLTTYITGGDWIDYGNYNTDTVLEVNFNGSAVHFVKDGTVTRTANFKEDGRRHLYAVVSPYEQYAELDNINVADCCSRWPQWAIDANYYGYCDSNYYVSVAIAVDCSYVWWDFTGVKALSNCQLHSNKICTIFDTNKTKCPGYLTDK